ncbi:ribonuclease H-like domain-containing protein [Tanacetum coccineum]
MLLFIASLSPSTVHRELFIEKKIILMASHDQQWYMDTRATFHLSSHTGNLQTSSLNRNFHSVIVENGSSIPITHSGHVQIPNPYYPIHLRNVLVTPNIIKNLVSVRKFTTDNKCFIDFDPYGFTVRDYHTRQTLLRCDSTGDLNHLHVVVASAFALLTNNHSLWHQRLGHPGDAANKQNFPFNDTSIVTSPFDIIHSDLWTSPVSSMSEYKYYVLFLDHYSHFLWVYPLHIKSDAQSKLLHFNVVYMSANPVQHQRTKHIDVDIHFVRDKLAAGHVRVLHVPSRFQYADIFTK